MVYGLSARKSVERKAKSSTKQISIVDSWGERVTVQCMRNRDGERKKEKKIRTNRKKEELMTLVHVGKVLLTELNE